MAATNGTARQLHRWLGLSAGLLFVLMALTGAGLVFRSQLEPVTHPHLLRVPPCAAPLAPSRLVAAARSAATPAAGALTAIRVYADPAASARVRFSDGRWMYVDPCSGRVLGAQDIYGGPFGLLAWLHTAGYASFGNIIAGATALAVIGLAIAGLVLWWPRRRTTGLPGPGRRPRAALAPAARRLRRHQRLAPWAAPVLLLLALTGLPQAFPSIASALDPALARIAASLAPSPPPTPSSAAAATPVQLLAALDTAWRQAGSAPWRQMQWRVPRAPGGAIVLELAAADAPHAYAAGIVHYDAVSGAPLRREDYAQSGAGRKAYLWGLALHYGAAGGTGWQLAQLLAALSVPILAWTGIGAWLARRRSARPPPLLELKLLGKAMVAEDICTFVFAAPRGRKLPPWAAGAHVDVHMAAGLVRQYSLCGDPHDRYHYRIAVLHCKPSRGGSRTMHEVLQPGDRVRLSLPRNHFPLAADASPSVLLAGGIGITPILAMAETLAANGAAFTLHYCVRTRGHVAFPERIAALQASGQVHLHIEAESGRANLDRLLAAAPRDTHLYICGPAAFNDAAVAAALRLDWPAAAVHTERFAADFTPQAGDTAFDLVLASSGQVIRVEAGQTALEALEAAKLAIPSSCRRGVCGSCITGVLEGEPEHRDQCLAPASHAANDCFTPCCSRARGKQLVLDL